METIALQSEGLEIRGKLRRADGTHPSEIVLFCHGAYETQENWSDFAERLCKDGIATFTFDFSGQGESQGTRGLVNLRIWAYNIRDVLSCLQERGFSRFAVVGWSSGGSAALLAAMHDAHICCAVILSAPVYLVPPLAERFAYGVITTIARVKKRVFRKPLTLSRLNELQDLQLLSDDRENEAYLSNPEVRQRYAAIPVSESLDSVWVDITSAVQKIEIPVLVIHGAKDKILSPDQSRMLYSLLHGPKDLKLMDGSGHAVHLDREKKTVYALIARWVRKYLFDSKQASR